MTTYYVRKSGNNSNNGLTPATAWKDIYVANSVASGSIVYVGAGYYNTQSGNYIFAPTNSNVSLIGDTSGQYTGDAGEVTLSTWITNRTTLPAGYPVIYLNGVNNITLQNLTVIGGGPAVSGGCVAALTSTGLTLTDCVFNGLGNTTTSTPLYVYIPNGSGAALNLTMNRCVVMARTASSTPAFVINVSGSSTAETNHNTNINSCLIQNFGASTSSGISIATQTNGSFASGGIKINNSTIMSSVYGVFVNTGGSASYLNSINNSVVVSGSQAIYNPSTYQFFDSGCVLYGLSNQSISSSSRTINTTEPAFEFGQSAKISGVLQPYLSPSPNSALAYSSSVVSTDFVNRPTISGSKYAVSGYLALHDFAIQDTTTYPTGYTSSAKIVGPGDQYLLIPVDPIAHQFSVQVYQGSGYTGTSYATATILANGELGIGAQTVTASSTLSAWQTLTFSNITPSKAGFITLQVTSYDTSGTGTLNFGAIN